MFSNALRTDMSSYTCVAVNDIPNILGTPESGDIALHVQGRIYSIYLFLHFLSQKVKL